MAIDEPPDEQAKRRADIKRAWETHEQRKAEPFNGVLGSLPDWVPDWHKVRFSEIRRRVLDLGYRSDEIVGYMNECEGLTRAAEQSGGDISDESGNYLTTEDGRVLAVDSDASSYRIPPEIETHIDALTAYRYVVSVGSEKGLRLLAGKNAVTGYKSATAYQMRDDFQDKQDFQGLLGKQRSEIHSIADVKRCPELASYTRKYKAETLRDWINEVIPGQLKAGRPRNR